MTPTHRPNYHFTPPQQWMNDPNGLVYSEGEYHLYYQHNPYDTAWGHMSWGHAVSPDLLHWEHLPIAIWEEPDENYTIFSGSAVIDHANTSGWGREGAPPLVAVYTADYRGGEARVQDIHVAYSLDRGRTFTKIPYPGNPVIAVGEAKFGDPKVFWHAPSAQWVMVNIVGHEQGHVALYGSPDLRQWQRLSEFHAPEAAPGVWECPDLFPLAVDGDPARVKWVLKTNCVKFAAGFSGTRYFVGDFDGTTFRNAIPTGAALTSDAGAIYAEVTYNDEPRDRRILMGWLRQRPHPERPWTGAQAIPRVLSLQSGPDGAPHLLQAPLPALATLRANHIAPPVTSLHGERALDVGFLPGRALEAQFTFTPGDAEIVGMRLELASGDVATFGYDAEAQQLFAELPGNQTRITTPLLSGAEGALTLRIFLDHDIVELFGGPGDVDAYPAGLTGWLPYGAEYAALSLFVTAGSTIFDALDVWELDIGG